MLLRHDSECEHVNFILCQVAGAGSDRSPRPPEIVIESWQRCLNDYKLDPGRLGDQVVLSATELKDVTARFDDFFPIARPEIEFLHSRVAAAGYVVALTDADGVAVDLRCMPALEEHLRSTGVHLGTVWAERFAGTNGVGTCIATNHPLTIHLGEHFHSRNIGLTCTVAPIHAPDGSLLAVLDVTSMSSHSLEAQVLVREIVESSARRIEHAYFLRRHREHWILRVHSSFDRLGLQDEILLAVDDAGTIVSANRNALDWPRAAPASRLVGAGVSQVFDIDPEVLLRPEPSGACGAFTVWTRDRGDRCFTLVCGPKQRPRRSADGAAERRPRAPGTRRGAAPRLGLDELAGADPKMIDNAATARRLVDRGLVILLEGDTGTGKEVFARALHDFSRRAGKPFVTIDCASIPENLIESELFGYEPGTFTGARRQGRRGKVVQAAGGTLFLDEIGDMPMALQTRFLRLLAEGEITPLGAAKPIVVDLSVICATHRDLGAMVAAKQFRRDLFYRIKGARLRLPSLSERADKAALIISLFHHERIAAGLDLVLGGDALTLLVGYAWPGNIRELKHALRYAIGLAEGGVVGPEHLPVEIAGAVAGTGQSPQPPDDEYAQVAEALRGCRWRVAAAARLLGVSRSTLHRKIKRLGLERPL